MTRDSTDPQSTSTRASDLVIETLALSEAQLIERVKDLEADNRSLRETLHEALATQHRTNIQLDRALRLNLELQQVVQDLQPSQAEAS